MARSIVIITLCFCWLGCSTKQEQEQPNVTIVGLQEENRVLEQEITSLKNQIKNLEASRTDQVNQLETINSKKLQDLEAENAKMHSVLGVAKQEAFALRETLQHLPEIENAQIRNWRIAMIISVMFNAVVILLSAYFVYRYRVIHDRLCKEVVDRTAAIRRHHA